MATPILAGTPPAPMTLADRAAQILGDVGDAKAMLRGAQALTENLPDGHQQETIERLLMLVSDRLVAAYEGAESLTIELDQAAEVSHG